MAARLTGLRTRPANRPLSAPLLSCSAVTRMPAPSCTKSRRLPAYRVLSFDMACTKAYAELLAKCRAAGLAVETANAFIAAVALANGFAVATRDTSPFEAAGVSVINPWQASP